MARSLRAVEAFDKGWRFFLGEAPGAAKPAFDDSAWRAVELPHDWRIEDLPPAPPEPERLSPTEGRWRFQPGDDGTWKEPAFDDGAWQEVALPATWESHSNYTQDNVYGWFRRRIEVPANLLGKDVQLTLGKIDDVDETFVNGVRVGSMGAFPPAFATAYDQPRVYTVPAGLLKGDGSDLVAVRVFDAQGVGGMYEAAAPAVRGGPFDSYALGGGSVGFTVGGVGWYRKAFALPERWKGRRVRVTFDGVYMNCQIWCNGKRVAEHAYGYTSFHVDLTDHVTFGEADNVIAVRVDARGITSRWYPGAGIYRHARLTVTDPIHVEPWGVCVSTQALGAGEATVSVRTAVRNDSGRRRKLTIRSRLVDPSGKTAATGAVEESVEAGGTHEFRQLLTVKTPALWSPESPALYRLESTLSAAGKALDATATTCGIRTVQVDAENGLRVNGRPMKLLGACVHHDNGALGSCTYDRAEERRVERLRAAGFNAIRTAHNPPSPAFLDACDRLGMLVMDEAFDTWHLCKGPQDYGLYFKTWWKRDLQSMVFRDRNHPSVIFWSIGNEVAAQEKPEALKLTKTLANFVRKLDATRPVAQAFMPFVPWDDLFVGFDALDVCGYNYKVERYLPDHEKRPRQVIAGTESYPKEAFACLTSAKDLPYVIGDFVWTGYDYLGEAALGRTRWDGEGVQNNVWPWTAAYCGDLDLCGWRRPQSYYREAVWGQRPLVACFVQQAGPLQVSGEGIMTWGWVDEQASWTWPGLEGRTMHIRAYSSCPRVRLTLNGRDLGVKDTNRDTKFTAVWELPYEPGELVAVGLDADNREADRWTLRTAGPSAALRLTPDRKTIAADGQDLCFVTVEVVDKDGQMNPRAGDLVQFTLKGPGTIVGVSNGDPRSIESFQQPCRKAFRGRCQVIIKAGETPGRIRLEARAEGLAPATAGITTKGR